MPKKSSVKPDEILIRRDTIDGYLFNLYLVNTGTDNAEAFCNENGIQVRIGALGPFKDVMESVLHELMEIYLMNNDARLISSKELDHILTNDCMFVLNHTLFQKMIYFSNSVLVNSLPVLYTNWARLNDVKKGKGENNGIFGNNTI